MFFLCPSTGFTQTTNLTPPVGSDSFGASVTVLANGNFVVSDPLWGSGSQLDVGAVYLYDGATLALISTLRGSKANDLVGRGGIAPLNNGNFIVLSPDWSVSTTNGIKAGAVTWINGKTGLSDTISAANSLVGASDSDKVGFNNGAAVITILSNGNFVISSPAFWKPPGFFSKYGAVTWGSSTTGVHGTIDATNSLIGLISSPYYGVKVVPLTNGNYVIRANYELGFYQRLGSITWGNGNSGIAGIVDTTNSIVGELPGDEIGSTLVPLTNGNYVIGSPNWRDAFGNYSAATWVDGTRPTSGRITASKSLTGGAWYIVPLSNGNYVVGNPLWSNGSAQYAGAATWGNGATGTTGVISSSNSLVGTQVIDQVGLAITPLANGNYIVQSPLWANGSARFAGAVTLGDGNAGVSGLISASNSLVGVTVDDHVGGGSNGSGRGGIVPLNNGNYVIASPAWSNGSAVYAGAVTWVNGITGIKGTVSASNSMVGTSTGDFIGEAGIVPLTNDNYVVGSPHWDNGTIVDAGAVTWVAGNTGSSGPVSMSNSLVGGSDSDMVGGGDIRALTNSNYVVGSPNWQNAVGKVGAATWGDGRTGITGLVSASNSLTGNSHNDSAANRIVSLSNGNFVVESRRWLDTSYLLQKGALTWGNGTTSVHGIIDPYNSLIGFSHDPYDPADPAIEPLSNGDYLVKTSFYIPAGPGGCTTYGNGSGGSTGMPNACNSVFGSAPQGGHDMVSAFNDTYEYLIVGFPSEKRVSIFRPSGQGLAVNNDSATHALSANAISPIPFVDLSSCRLISSILPIYPNPLVGEVTSVAFVEQKTSVFAGIPYVRRHFDINTETAPDVATARLTLYFNQSDFTDYNSNNGSDPDLPSTPSDLNGKANTRIIQEYGTSSTGVLGSYTSTNPARFNVINPPDSNIVWNSHLSRWEVTVDVQGLGGFFAYGEHSATAIEGIKSGNSSPIIVSPIPATSELFISVRDAKLCGQLASITDIHGRQILRFTLESHTSLNIREWPAGVYCLHLLDAGVIKIVKQ